MEWYNTYHGIFDHLTNNNNPLAVCEKHTAEDSHDFGFRAMLFDYLEYDFKGLLDISFAEYCTLPREVIMDMREVIILKTSAKSAALNNLKNELDKLG